MGLPALCVYAFVGAAEGVLRRRDLANSAQVIAVAVISIAVTMVTPWSIVGWRAALVALRNPLSPEVMNDWYTLLHALRLSLQGPRAGSSIYLVLPLFAMAATIVTWLLTPRWEDLGLMAIAFVMIIAAFDAVRNIAFAAIAITAPLARHCALLVNAGAGSEQRREPLPRRPLFHEALVAFVAITFALETGLLSRSIFTPADFPYPAGAIAFMNEHGLHGNVLTEMYWAQYLIWHQPPSRVFVDGRYDMVYPPKVIIDYFDFALARPGAGRVLHAYPHQFVLIRADYPDFGLMMRQSDWRLIYRGRMSALFAPATSRAANIVGVPVSGIDSPQDHMFP